MADFDLSQALDTTPVEKPLRSCLTADAEDESCPYDMQLIISCNHKSMRRMANLVVVILKFQKALSKFGELSDKQRCNAIFESVIEERSTEILESKVKKIKYQRVDSVNQCTLCDGAQKVLIHPPGEVKLHAVTLKGGNCEQKVRFQLCRYISTEAKGQPVLLTILNSSLHLTCSMQGSQAVLNLEDYMLSELQKISSENNMDRFLFYKIITGVDMRKFESVSCPGWYISTCLVDEGQPVEMCKVDRAATRLTEFKEH
uniref:Interleukin-1 n=1 Tax=Neogobius melanostomus TaxID=47308 RepID=A0A8C6S1L2_9GOBI